MSTIDKAALLAKRFGVEDVEIPGVGTVQIRPLSRAEGLALQGAELDVAEMERRLVSLAMISPQLTEDEVRQWQENSPVGELEPITEEIIRLSGMDKAAAKEAYKQFRE